MTWSIEEALEEIENQLAESYFWLMGGEEGLTEEDVELYKADCKDMGGLFLEASDAQVISTSNDEVVIRLKRVDMYEYFDVNIPH